MIRHVYLTIDDAPSKHTTNLVRSLAQRKIPAVFYARGEFIARSREGLLEAIRHGFLVGNHSYSHPYFSKIGLDECFKEIEKTETLIDQCYRDANRPREMKVIRLPWSDRGAGADLKPPSNNRERDRCQRIQEYLKSEGFSRLNFEGFDDDHAIDAPYSWKTDDFKERYLRDHKGFIANMSKYFQQSRRVYEIILAHDFDRNAELLRLTIDFLIDKRVVFVAPHANHERVFV